MIGSKLIKRRKSTLVLDLSHLELGRINKLGVCNKLQMLNLQGNNIDYISNLESCAQLWTLNLDKNQIKNLEGLSRFIALGSLVLSNNDLVWSDLYKIKHLRILDLELHGNPELEKDPHYRAHVVDSLPNVWMLDGMFISSIERAEVEKLFEESALTEKPVRHKLRDPRFTPTSRKHIEVHGIHGHRAAHMLGRFPLNGPHNSDIDGMQLRYIALNVAQDILLENKARKRFLDKTFHESHLQELLQTQSNQDEQFCMLLMLLLATMHFEIPKELLKSMLTTAQLEHFGRCNSSVLFGMIHKEGRSRIARLLINKLHLVKQNGKETVMSGRLYGCIFQSLIELTPTSAFHSKSKRGSNALQTSRILVAAEVVQLLCVVPEFFGFLPTNKDVQILVATAIQSQPMLDTAMDILKQASELQDEDAIEGMYGIVTSHIQSAIDSTRDSVHVSALENTSPEAIISRKRPLTKRPMSSPIRLSEYHTRGSCSPDARPARVQSGKPKYRHYIPRAQLGDRVLLGPQNIARVMAIPEPDIILVQLDVVADQNTGAMIVSSKSSQVNYTYINMNHVYWDHLGGYWRQKGTSGDMISIRQSTAPPTIKEHHYEQSPFKDSASASSEFSVMRSTSHARQFTSVAEETSAKGSSMKPVSILKTRARPVSAQLQQKLGLRLNVGSVPRAKSASHLKLTGILSTGAKTAWQDDITSSQVHDRKQVHIEEPLQVKTEDRNTTPQHSLTQSRVYSRRSSLESVDEPELRNLNDSRPSTAVYHAGSIPGDEPHSMSVDGRTTSDQRIEIPQAADDMERESHSETASSLRKSSIDSGEIEVNNENRSSHNSGDAELRLHMTTPIEGVTNSTTPTREDYAVQAPTPSAASSIINLSVPEVSKGQSHANAVSWQKEMSEIYKRRSEKNTSRPSSALSASNLETPDSFRMILGDFNNRPNSGAKPALKNPYKPSRSCTPGGRSVHFDIESPASSTPDPVHKSTDAKGKTPINVHYGGAWLAGGRDLYTEKRKQTPRTHHVPGYREGQPPNSATDAAHRAMRRAQVPNITTPSSLLYDFLIGRDTGSQQKLLEAAMENSGDFESPLWQRVMKSQDLSIDDFLQINGGIRKRLESSVPYQRIAPGIEIDDSTLMCSQCFQKYLQASSLLKSRYSQPPATCPHGVAMLECSEAPPRGADKQPREEMDQRQTATFITQDPDYFHDRVKIQDYDDAETSRLDIDKAEVPAPTTTPIHFDSSN